MKRYPLSILTLILTTLLLNTETAQGAGDQDAGHEKARTCAACHGIDGKGRIPLAGKTADYLEEQLRAYQSGARHEETMNAIAKQLDDQDISDLAAYFASQ
jgi:cytochrome c553